MDSVDEEDVKDIRYGLPTLEELLEPDFFRRPPLSFPLLRRSLDLHDFNPISDEYISLVPLLTTDKSNSRIFEQVWFLLFLCAQAQNIPELLNSYREKRTRPTGTLYQPSADASPLQYSITKSGQEIRSIGNDSNALGYNNYNPRNNLTPPPHPFQDSILPHDMTKTEPKNRHSEIIPRTHDPIKSTEGSPFDQGKKGHAVESYFRDRKFTGAPDQSIDNLIRDYEICAIQQCLDRHQLSLFFINDLADPAPQYFLRYCSSRMSFDQIAATMRKYYNSDTKKLQLQSEIDSIDLTSFMR